MKLEPSEQFLPIKHEDVSWNTSTAKKTLQITKLTTSYLMSYGKPSTNLLDQAYSITVPESSLWGHSS